jgi:hypothetical protein
MTFVRHMDDMRSPIYQLTRRGVALLPPGSTNFLLRVLITLIFAR